MCKSGKNIIKLFVIAISIILFIPFFIFGEENNNVKIKDIFSFTKVKDEWKNPGQYSPANLFDNNIDTCYAVENEIKKSKEARMSAIIIFSQPLLIDEIGIVNGNAKSDELYRKSSRVKLMSFYLDPTDDSIKENVILEDRMGLQNRRLSKTYNVKEIQFAASPFHDKVQSLYIGSNDNSIYLSEMAFYYKGVKVDIKNSGKPKKEYIDKLHNKLIDNFTDKNYYWDSGEINTTSYKNGHFKVRTGSGNKPDYIPDRWKVRDAKLYMRMKGKWLLFEYWLSEPDRKTIILYDPYYKGEPQSDGILGIFQPEIKNENE